MTAFPITTTPPFAYTDRNVRSINIDFLIALTPAMIWAVYMFGARVLTMLVLSVLFSVGAGFAVNYFLTDKNIERSLGQSMTLSDVLTGVVCALMLPVAAPLYFSVLVPLLSVPVVRVLSVKVGFRSPNPALVGTVVVKILFASAMGVFTRPFAYFNAFTPTLSDAYIDVTRVFSPLQMLGRGAIYEDGAYDLFYGVSAGNIGEVAIALIALGGLYLAWRKLLDIRFTVGFLASVFLLAALFPQGDGEPLYIALTELMAGGVVFLSVFACAGLRGRPRTTVGSVFYGVTSGVLTIGLRYLTGHAQSAHIAVLLVSLAVPFVDKFARPAPYGLVKKKQ